jgi:DNA-binding transcriptional LysR family regulator
MTIELQHMRQIVALAEHGSFVRAAAALHISQPALSRSIRNVEVRFGKELFVRSGTGVVPTDLGRLYVERARDLLRMADELEGEGMLQGSLQRGRVAVGGGPFPAESFLGPAAARLVEQYPQVGVQVRAHNWDELLRLLRSRELDFFVAETSTLARETDLEIEPLPSEHSVHFFARAGHPLTRERTLTAAQVLAWPFATPSRVPPRILEPMLLAHRAAAGALAVPRPFPSIDCNGLAAVKRVIATSNAVSASILSCIATELEADKFVLLGTEPWMHLQYGIVSLRGRPWTQAAARLRDYVMEAEGEASADEVRLSAKYGSPARAASVAATQRAPRRS